MMATITHILTQFRATISTRTTRQHNPGDPARMDVNQFKQTWIIASQQKESSAAKSHFIDLCALLGVPTPTEADPTGDEYTFERGASITAGGNGW